MTRHLSLYLDLLRSLAALAVYLFHASHFAQARVPVIGNSGNEAVIVFFVLSGMLIMLAGLRQPDLGAYMQARLSRLWSVCLPALFLTMAADLVGQAISQASYSPFQPYSAFKWAASIGFNALFLNQTWDFNVYAGTNGPFWSLSYEFWYYMLFAAFVYFKGGARIVAVAGAALIAGPSILTGFPVWLMGAAVYLGVTRLRPVRTTTAWILWLGSFAAAILLAHAEFQHVLRSALPEIAASARWDVNFWPTSYLIGAIVATNVYAFAFIGHVFSSSLEKNRRWIRFGAEISFGLYLFHYPLMYLCKAILNASGVMAGMFFIAAVYVIPFAVSATLALYCEKHKNAFARGINFGISFVAKHRKAMTFGAGFRLDVDPLAGGDQNMDGEQQIRKLP